PDYQECEPTIHLGLSLDRPILHERIAARVELMWDQGWVDEVRRLLEAGLAEGRTASRAIGYAQIRRHLDGELTAAEAKEETIIRTRQFARRQETWFRRDPRIHWIDGSAHDAEANLAAALDMLAGVCAILGTRQSPRRQETWVRRAPRIHWIDGSALDAEAKLAAALDMLAEV